MATRLEISLLKRLSELEQEFLGKFEKQLHALMIIPPLYTEQQIAQWHLPHAGELARLLTSWMRDAYAVGQAHGDLLVGDLQRRFGKHKLVDRQPFCYRLASVGYSPKEFWLSPDEAIKEFSKRELLLADDVEGDISKQIKGFMIDHLHGIPRAQTEEAIAALLEKNKNRARLITTTETTYAYNRGRLTSYHGSDVDYVRFSAVMDMRTSPQCRSRHGLVMRLDSPDLSGNIPPLHGRCRSVLSPLFSKYQPELITPEATDWSHVTPLPKGWRVGNESVIVSQKNGIIKADMNIKVDKFTPCLVDRKTGEIKQTEYSKATTKDVRGLKKQGWNFDWTMPGKNGYTVYKLTLQGSDEIEGLIAFKGNPDFQAVEIDIAESAPHNIGSKGKYEGVGGHLFAIAAKHSFEAGFDGYLSFMAKTKLFPYYAEKFGAVGIGGQRMMIQTKEAKKLLEIYTFSEKGVR